jgi:UDP-N-acetylglucosamine 4,6-dehydratase/5-epimerase
LKNIFSSDSEIKIMGMRQGEKLHETLASKDELLRSEDMGDYLRLSMDDRDLNYNEYLSEGDKKVIQTEGYTSQNTTRLTIPEMEKMLLAQPEIIAELKQQRL